SSFISSIKFEGKIIQSHSHFLIASSIDADIVSDLTLTENNSLVLKNPNREIVDLVGWGEAQDFEVAPFPQNPEIRDPIGDWLSEIGFKGSREPFPSTIYYQSLGRKINEENNYQDTDNNAEDFEIQTPTPKAKNKTFIEPELEDILKSLEDILESIDSTPSKPEPEPEEPSEDSTPPEIVFGIDPIQTSLSFIISFEITSPLDTVTPSGLDSFVFRWKEEDEEEWQEDEYQEITEAPINYSGELEFTGEDEKTYYFQIKAKDVAGNESDWLPELAVSTKISLPKIVLINEIQIDSIVGTGGTSDDWVELYNPYDIDISLTGWSIQKHSKDDPCSINKSFDSKTFSRNERGIFNIPAKGFFLIVNTTASESLKVIADMTISWSLSDNNTVYLVGNEDKIESGDDPDIIDKVGFGLACFAKTEPFLNPPEAKSIERKELSVDTNNNNQDFKINEVPTPTNSKGETFSPPSPPSFGEPPWPMFQHDAQHTGRSPFAGPEDSENLEILIEGEADDDYFGTPVIGSDGTLYLNAKITTGGEIKEGLWAF
ncbi:unnamed protein product, partial [marine sediment metagenome]